MNKISLSTIIIVMSLVIFSCKGPEPVDENNPESKTDTVVFDTRAYESWVYFSFDKGKEITINDYKNSMEWDIAFHRFDVRVNCGTSGPGKGGSIDMGVVNFADVKEAPLQGYSLNDSISIVNKPGGWLEQVTVPGDTVVANWLHFTGPPPQYNITNRIFVIKTADGKYVKIWLPDY